jgi:hypothetical protein
MTLDVLTGEIMPVTAGRMSTTQAAEAATWLREMLRSVLTEGEDYGLIPGTKKPTLFKAGAEMLVLASGMRFDQCRLDDEGAREHEGITYRCTVYRGDYPQAVCDGYAGYDERNFAPPNKPRAGWNTIIKMAQKRALVGAALNAVAGSALFAADLDDPQDTPTEPPARRYGKRVDERPAVAAAPEPQGVPGTDDLVNKVNALGNDDRKAFRAWMRSAGLTLPPETAEALRRMLSEVDAIAQRANERAQTYEPPVGSPND